MPLNKLVLSLLLALPPALPAIAQTAMINEFETARTECAAYESGILDYGANVVTYVELAGGSVIKIVFDTAELTCSTMPSMFCGSGGCRISVIANDTVFHFLAKGWSVQNNELSIGVHWSECDYQNGCTETFQWDGNTFISKGTAVPTP